jgi:hypothetical protein
VEQRAIVKHRGIARLGSIVAGTRHQPSLDAIVNRGRDRHNRHAMADIDVRCSSRTGAWICEVTVAEGGSETRHSVTVTGADLERLASPGTAPEDLVRRSFEFLLEREPKESILRQFELPVIGRYFPEYEAEIRRR